MSERSLSARISRFLLSALVIAVGSANSHAQQVPGSARPANSNPSHLPNVPEVLIAQNQGSTMDIPSVVDRPLGKEEGPRVLVNRFDLSGAVDREKQGILVGDLNVILNGHVSRQPPDGFTIGLLQDIADEITRYYRDRGLILAQAIVPSQDVQGGVVSIQVLEGSLEDVVVEGNRIYKSRVVEGPFRRLQGRPVTQDSIERALLDVQDFPGLTVFGTFTQGDEVGNTDLVVRVREEDRAYITPSVDNYGSQFTGEYRALIDFKFNNLLGIADQINGYILKTFEPDNGTYGGLNFTFPFGRNAVGIGASTNRFDVGGLANLTDLGVKGTADQANIFWDYAFANGRFFGASARLDLAVKEAITEVPSAVLSEDNLTVASVEFDFFHASRAGKGFTVGNLAVDVGIPGVLGAMDESGNGLSSRIGSNGEFAGGDFTKVGFNIQHLRRITKSNSVLLRLDGQYSADLLVALEQYSIGGPQNVRAYSVAEVLVDSGASATLEWLINAPGFADKPLGGRTWGEVFQVAVYVDFAYGEVNDPLLFEDATFDLSGYGLGLQFNMPGQFYGRFDVASPFSDRPSTNGRDPQYFFRMSYTF